MTDGICPHCGGSWTSTKPNTRFCSDRCQRRAGEARRARERIRCHMCGGQRDRRGMYCTTCKARRLKELKAIDRARRKGQIRRGDLIYAQDVYARDGYRCQLCGRPLAMHLKPPHPKAPTVDHILPLAGGGAHTLSNVQSAHFQCNSSKGARGTDQLRLIG